MTFPYQAILSINGNIITDHNRSTLDVSYERIENRQRSINGTMRINYITTKLKVSTSWSNVVSSNNTVDGNKGAAYLRDLYNSSAGDPVTVALTFKSGPTGSTTGATASMVFSNFDYSVVQRGQTQDIVNMSVELEQV